MNLDGWVIETHIHLDGPPTFDIYHDRYIVEYDVPSLQEAEDIIARSYSREEARAGVDYTLIEADGYEVTQRVR